MRKKAGTIEEAVDDVMQYIEQNHYATTSANQKDSHDFYTEIVDRCQAMVDGIESDMSFGGGEK